MSKPQKFSVHVIYGRYSVFWRHCDMLGFSDFVDDVMFAHNGQKQVVRERILFTKANIQYQYHKTITSGRLPEGAKRTFTQ